ncbi:hypothetical protein [Mariniblastus fucicola]|uniref:Uncharacterized protein n=1 Tax=Mariniblastus fucicola TaxID=980251 RepID=A0A5B9P9P5_9BACT|nr:hypothetical protein [Mariniblastus fucicola]QEG23048.1 hypothetical protein MFFC18_29400 [Mariniblastus fucicola]
MLFRRLHIGFLAAMILACTSANGYPDITVINGREIRPHGASPVGEYGQIYKITVTPAKETVPAFKYRFTVPPHRTIPGNAITHYLRSLGERSLSSPWESVRKDTERKVNDWSSSSTPSNEIPMDQLKSASAAFDSYVQNHMRRATLCRDVDWGIAVEDMKGPEIVEFLLPSVQATREMARALLLQNRLAIEEQRFDDAADRLRMTYQLGQNVNEMGFLVSSLVGVAEVGMANDGVLLFAAAKDSPNLYWALAELPTPIIDIRKSLQLDISMPMRMFPELMDIENTDFSADQWKKLLVKYTNDFGKLQAVMGGRSSAKTSQTKGISMAVALAGYSNAKQRMIERGYSEDKVEQMSVSQVILTDAALDIEYFIQMQERISYVPASKADQFHSDWEKLIRKQELKLRLGAIVVTAMSPATAQVRKSAFRVQAQVNLLMAIESLRNHAAVHGKFPESLQDLALPVRANPLTERPFNYSLEGGKAVISLDLGHWDIHRYELSLKEEVSE